MLPKNPAAEVVGLEVETNLVTWKQEWSCLKQRGIQWVWGRLPREAKAAGLWTTLQVNQSHSVVSDSFRPLGLHSPWDSPGQNTGVGSFFPSPGHLPNPGIKPKSPVLQADSLSTEPQEKTENMEWVAYPFSRESSQPRN